MSNFLYDPTPFSTYFSDSNAFLDAVRANTEVGRLFHIFNAGAQICGARVYSLKSGAHTIRLKLWRPQDTTGTGPVRNQDFLLSGPGMYILEWDTPYAVTLYDMQQEVYNVSEWILGIYDPDNINHTINTVSGFEHYGKITCNHYGYSQNQDTNYYSNFGGEGKPLTGWGAKLPIDPLVIPADTPYEPTPWVHAYGADRTGIQSAVGNRTTGLHFRMNYHGTFMGVRCYSAITGAHTLKGSIWDSNGALKVSGTLAVPGPGYYDIMFGTPYVTVDADLQQTDNDHWRCGVYETSGTHYTYVNPAVSGWAPRQWSWWSLAQPDSGVAERYGNGDTRPDNTLAGNNPVAPLVVPVYGAG